MSGIDDKRDIVSECHILTKYPVEEFTFTWKVTNFSKVFNIVRAQLKTFSGATTWELRLVSSRKIEIWRYVDGDTLKVKFTCYLFTDKGTIKNNGEKIFGRIFDHCVLMEFEHTSVFKNDVFHFKCTMDIIGHRLTNEIKSTGSELTNFKYLSCDMRDLFEKQEHCDLTMAVGQDKIQVHKSILCARSPVFNKMFQCPMLETECKEIQIHDIDFDVLKNFLIFLYSGELQELSWNSALQLYYAADKYEVISLRETCSDFLGLNLEVDKVCDALKLADLHGDEKLKECAMYYAKIHSSAVKLTESWQDLLRTHPRLAVEIFA